MGEGLVSLVTVTFNSASTLREFWADWPKGECEWIVVDNCSEDDSAAVAESLGARVIRLPENRGFSAANNAGAEVADGDVLGFVNPDVSVTLEGVKSLGDTARSRTVLVAPQLTNPDGTLQENGRGAPYPARKLAHMFAPGSGMNARYVRHVDAGLTRVVWVMGAAVFASKDTFRAIGGWDSDYFIYYEDSDICLRALRHGVPTYVDGDVRLTHGWARETAARKSWAPWKHEVRSALRFYSNHPECIAPMGRAGRLMRQTDRGVAR